MAFPPNERKTLFSIENHDGRGSGNVSKSLAIPLPTVKKALADFGEEKPD